MVSETAKTVDDIVEDAITEFINDNGRHKARFRLFELAEEVDRHILERGLRRGMLTWKTLVEDWFQSPIKPTRKKRISLLREQLVKFADVVKFVRQERSRDAQEHGG